MADLGAIAGCGLKGGPLHGGTIKGVVHDNIGNPTARYIRAYHKGSGALSGGAQSDPVTGEYTALTNVANGLEEHYVVELNPDGSENHRIRGFVMPDKGF